MTDAADPTEPSQSSDARLSEGIEHLQRAAREMIAASRAVLDVVEQLVEDPDTIGRLGAAIGSAASRARSAGSDWEDPGDSESTVQRIRVD